MTIETIHAPHLVAGNSAIQSSKLSSLDSQRRRNALGIRLAVDNAPALCSYEAPEQAPASAVTRDPVELEALRLAETIRTAHKNAGDHNNFLIPDFSEQRVLYAALAILNKEGLKLGSMCVADEGCWKMWFHTVEPVEYDDAYSGC